MEPLDRSAWGRGGSCAHRRHWPLALVLVHPAAGRCAASKPGRNFPKNPLGNPVRGPLTPCRKTGASPRASVQNPPGDPVKKTYGARPVLGRRRRSLCSCNVGVPTLRQRGEGSMRKSPTAAAERRKVCYVPMLRRGPATSNADELDAVPKRQGSLPR